MIDEDGEINEEGVPIDQINLQLRYFIQEVKAYDKAMRLNRQRLEEDAEYAEERINEQNEMFLRLRYTYLSSEVQISV